MIVGELLRLEAGDDDGLRALVRSPRPMILAGVANAWPARRWTLADLERVAGDAVVTVTDTTGSRLVVGASGLVQRRLPLRQFLREGLTRPDGGYVMANWEELPGSLTQDAELPARIFPGRVLRRRLWISSDGTISPLHRDMPHNVLVQLTGHKTVWLAAPRESRHVVPHSFWSGAPNLAHADFERPDYERWPQLRQARVLLGRIGPGDAVQIPSGWWHQIRSEGTSISANVWWAGGWTAWLAGAADRIKRARRLSR